MGLDRSFLSLLTASVGLERFLGEDQWGNSSYAALVTAQTFIDPVTRTFGSQDGQDKQDAVTVDATRLTTDALGIKPRDRITLPGGMVVFVTDVATNRDEKGAELYQEVTAQSSQRG